MKLKQPPVQNEPTHRNSKEDGIGDICATDMKQISIC